MNDESDLHLEVDEDSNEVDNYSYSGKVARCWKAVPTTKSVNSIPSETTDSETNESNSLHDKAVGDKIVSAPLESSDKCNMVEIDDAIELDSLTEPTRNITKCLAKKKRMKKGVKTAFKTLEKMKKFICNKDDEDDCVEVKGSPSGLLTSPQHSAVTVRVRCPKTGVQRFHIKPTDDFSEIVADIAKSELTEERNVMMLLNDKVIHPYDTPLSIHLHVADIIECHIRQPCPSIEVSSTVEEDPSNEQRIPLLVQHGDKNKTTITLHKNEPMRKLILEFCTMLHVKSSLVSFVLDGEAVNPSSTPSQLGLEPNDCIDAVFLVS